MLIKGSNSMIKTVKELKERLSRLQEDAQIQIGDGYRLKDINNITKVINMDTNIGLFVINIKD